MAARLPASTSVPSRYAPGRYLTDPSGRVWLVRSILNRHQVHRPFPARCLDEAQLEEALDEKGAVGVILNVRDTGQRYFAPLPFFEAYGKSVDNPGHGRQVALALEDWTPFATAWPPADLPEHPRPVAAARARQAPPTKPCRPQLRFWHELDEQPKPGRPVGWQQPERLPFA